jgi:hypothetical protein
MIPSAAFFGRKLKVVITFKSILYSFDASSKSFVKKSRLGKIVNDCEWM